MSYIYGMLKITAEYDRDTSLEKLTEIYRQVYRCFLLDVSAGIFQSVLVDESGMIRTEMGTHNRSENDRSALDAFHVTTSKQ
jgi:hypothetical protein